MKFFDKRYIHYGSLEYKGKIIGSCRCEVVTNEIEPDSWKGTISVFEGSAMDLHRAMDSPYDLQFVSKDDQETLTIKLMFPSLSMSSYNDELLKFRIKEFSLQRKYDIKETTKVFISYFIPFSELYKRRVGVSQHYMKGLLSGWEGWRREYGDGKVTSEWNDEINSLPSPIGEIAFIPIMLFKETPIEETDTTVVVDQMIIQCTIEKSELALDDAKKTLDEIIADYLYILSFLEGDFLDWYFCRGTAQGSDKKLILEIENYRSIAKRKKPKHFVERFHKYRQNLQKVHVDLTRVFQSKTPEEKNEIRKVIDRYLVASRVSTIDTRLIYWHSCLDVLAKQSKGEGKSFSHKVVSACKNAAIDWLDIYPEINEQSLEEKAEFPINRIRNQMLHDGEYPDDYNEVLREIPKTKALCERLITKMIGVDYNGTGLGIIER